MALETLRGIKEIDGYLVKELTDFVKKRPEEYIIVQHKNNGISFKMQDGPAGEVGFNGCDVTVLIHTAKIMIDRLNEKFPCKYNDRASQYLDHAIFCMDTRKKDRQRRGVEGFDKA